MYKPDSDRQHVYKKEVEHPTNTYDNCWYERAMTDYFTQPLAHNANPINHCRLIPFWQLYLYLSKVKEKWIFIRTY